ncbi:hypothetical protein AHF37_02210 [Paragonimus kellicotti]|nr:hypothetical protein AHF37_02210 [Paragonimus kellicotti]
MWMKTVFQDPTHNVGACPTTRDSSSVDCDKLKTCIETELTNRDEAEALSALSFLLNELSLCQPDASNTHSLGLLCEITLSTLVSHIRKPLPSSVSSCIDELASNPHFQDLVFSSFLPSVLLVSVPFTVVNEDSPVSLLSCRSPEFGFVLNLLRTATPHSRLMLLRVLCSSDNFWPNDSFPVLQFLITSIDDMTTTGDLVVRAFQKQLRSNNALYESVPFTNLLIHFVRAHSNHLAMNIGDRFISELLDTKLVEEGTYRRERVFSPNPRTIYGGELMAQALVAASKTVPDGFKAHSLHCYFHDRIHRLVEAFAMKDQINGDPPAFFRMDCSFKAPENDPACFVTPMPKVLTADQVPYIRDFVKSLDMDKLSTVSKDRIKIFLSFDSNSPMDIKICEPEYLLGLKSNPTGRLHAWVRLKQAPAVPLEPYRDAILVYFSDAVLLWSAITEPHPVNYLVTLNQSVWFHNPFFCPKPDEWVLFETRANYVGDALTLSYGAMWNAEGQLLASVAQQGLMRTQPLTPVSSANGLVQYDNGHPQST